MKSYPEYLTFNVPQRMDFINITPQVEAAVAKSGVAKAWCCATPCTSRPVVFINDDERGLHEDYKQWLEELAPFDPSPKRYQHNRTGEDNADAHHKRQIMGARSSWRSPRASSISGRGSKSSTANSTAGGRSACWSKSSGSEL